MKIIAMLRESAADTTITAGRVAWCRYSTGFFNLHHHRYQLTPTQEEII
jgi:hypothetical protein